LGKDSEGRSAPVEVKLRPKGVGIGFSDDDEEEDEKEKEKEKEDKWSELQAKKNSVRTLLSEKIPSKRPVSTDERKEYEIVSDVIEPTTKADTVEIIDMQRSGFTESPPLSRLLSELTLKKKSERICLQKTQEELDSLARQVKLNAVEVCKDKAKLKEIKEANEVKGALKRLVQLYLNSDECGLEDFCVDGSVVDLLKRRNTELLSVNLMSLIDKVIMSILASKYDCNNVELTAKLASLLPLDMYSQLIYYYWWPQMRVPNFVAVVEDYEAWQGVIETLSVWSAVLPDDFLVSFLGYQVLVPRFHALLNGNEDFSVESRRISIKVWQMFREQIRMPSEVLDLTLKVEIVSWLKGLIVSVPVRKFDELLLEFVEEWRGRDLIPVSDLRLLIEAAWIPRIQRLLQRDLVIDPANQDLVPLEGLFLAFNYRIIDATELSSLLSVHLIPKLSRCVRVWLKSPQVDFEEVAQWYMAWKDLMPEEMKEDKAVLDGFGTILNVINDQLT
jgi:tuftelin-interacting protein 11